MKNVNTVKSSELQIYCIVWISAVIYSIYSFSKSSSEYFQSFHDEYSDFKQGWSVLGRKQDISDYEWETLKYFIKVLYPWITASVTVSELLRRWGQLQILPFWQIFITIACILKEFGSIPLAALLFQPLVFFLLTFILFEKKRVTIKKSAIWITCGLILILITLQKKYNLLENLINDARIDYITIVSVSWMNLKCLCYSFDSLSQQKKPQFVEFFAYCFYLPVFFTGPFISYKNFKYSHEHNDNIHERSTSLFFNLSRFFFWLFFGEIFLYFVYVNATSFHPDWVATLDHWSLYGYGYSMGQFFHIKYVVFYGLTTSLAKFEGIPTPTLPICIGRVHLYSDMWRYFDAGLYEFLLKYIYVPTIGNGFIRSKLFSSFLCFAFVYVWHGTENYILIWSVFNYIGIVMEKLLDDFYKNSLERSKIMRRLGPSWIRRIICAFSTQLLAFSAISNFYFFARTEIGNVFLMRYLSDSWTSTLVLVAILYTCCQISTELRIRRKKHKHK